jgi:hypothetical protein
MRRAPDIIEVTFTDLMRGQGLEPLPREAIPEIPEAAIRRDDDGDTVFETPTARWRYRNGALVRFVAYDASGEVSAWWDRG